MQQSEFIDEYLKPLTEKLISENKEVILLGDFNIDLLKWDSNKNVSDFLDIKYSTNLLPNITSPTRLTSRSQTLIDNIFSSVINDDCIAGNLISPISHQHAQFLILPNYTITQKSKKDIYKRNFNHFSSKKFITDLEKVNWDNILNVSEGNVNKSFENFSNKITDILDKHVPITKLSLKEMRSSNKPWLTKGILKSINQKNAIHGIFIRAKNLHSKEIYHLELKMYKSMIIRLTRINKSKYYKTFFREHKTNYKRTREAVRSLINVKIKSKQISSLNINNQIETNPKTISEDFNKFFSTIAKDIDNKIIPTNKTHKDYLNASIVNSFFLTPTNDEEVKSLIKEMNTSKSVGSYSIPTNILKLSCSVLSKPLVKLINFSFSEDTFPDLLKFTSLQERRQSRL